MAREQRRLAAIVAADVVGYSRLMGRDESGTLARLREHRKQRFEPTLARHGGRLVKLTGDGTLAEFPSAVDALGAAIEFQQVMAEANRDQPEETAIVFRIGLHLGDLIVDGDDLYGDGVNVAARLEAEAPPGGIVVSRAVREAVEGRLKAKLNALGELTLKNIERPIRAFRVEWDPADWQATAAASPKSVEPAPPIADVPLTLPDKPSIAVLPFQNISGDPEQEYFADGMVEDIITALSRFKSLFVIARNSSFTYKGKAVDIKQVGRELGVRYVLEGSVRKAVNKIRITGQLIDSETGTHLWADRFDGVLEDVFQLQDDITTSVVGAIAPKLDQAEMERAKRKPVENLDAYDSYLRGMAIVGTITEEAQDEARRLFYRAIELNPNFATPYGMAARCYMTRKIQRWTVDQMWEEAEIRRLASRVAAIGRDDALALCWAGYPLAFVCLDYETGADLTDQALAINPNLAAAWQNRAWVSVYEGQHDAALEQMARAIRLNPLSSEIFRAQTAGAFALMFLGRFDEASVLAGKALRQEPNAMGSLRVAAVSNALGGRLDEASRIMERICQLAPNARLSGQREVMPFRRPVDKDRQMEGLRLAGMPE